MSSTPVAVNNATADVGIFLMIGALRQAYIPLTAIRAGKLCSLYASLSYPRLIRTDLQAHGKGRTLD